MKNSNLMTSLRDAQKSSFLISSLLICLMMVTLSVGLWQFGQRFSPDWKGGYLVVIGAVLSLEAILTRASTRELDSSELWSFHISEWVAFAVLIKLLIYAANGFSSMLPDVRSWQESFLSNFFTLEYLLALGTAALVWLSSRAYIGEMEGLFDREQDATWDDLGKLQNALNDIRVRMINRIFFQGTFLVILAVLGRLEASALLRTLNIATPGYRAPVFNLLVYFMLALVLLSQTQFALMRTRWTWLNLTTHPTIPVNWLKYSLLFFAALGIVVFFLPTDYTYGLLATLQGVLSVLVKAFYFIIALITLPFTFCMSLFSITSGEDTPSSDSPLLPPPPMLQPEDTASTAFPWFAFLRSLVFWVVFVGVIFFAIKTYLRQNVGLWNAIRSLPFISGFARAWQALWIWLRGARKQVGSLARAAAARIQLRRPSLTIPAIRDLFDARRLSPRDKVIFLFLSLTRLSGERGVERKPYQTPYQYEQYLRQEVPNVDPDLHELTQAFYEARYSKHPLEEDQAAQADTFWQRIKKVLQSWQK